MSAVHGVQWLRDTQRYIDKMFFNAFGQGAQGGRALLSRSDRVVNSKTSQVSMV